MTSRPAPAPTTALPRYPNGRALAGQQRQRAPVAFSPPLQRVLALRVSRGASSRVSGGSGRTVMRTASSASSATGIATEVSAPGRCRHGVPADRDHRQVWGTRRPRRCSSANTVGSAPRCARRSPSARWPAARRGRPGSRRRKGRTVRRRPDAPGLGGGGSCVGTAPLRRCPADGASSATARCPRSRVVDAAGPGGGEVQSTAPGPPARRLADQHHRPAERQQRRDPGVVPLPSITITASATRGRPRRSAARPRPWSAATGPGRAAGAVATRPRTPSRPAVQVLAQRAISDSTFVRLVARDRAPACGW